MFGVDSQVEDGWQTTRVRVLKASWGMAVALTARAVSEPGDGDVDERIVAITPDLTLDARGARPAEAELHALVAGLRLVAGPVSTATERASVTILVRTVTWTPPDYQPDVTTIAMAHWAAEQFDVPAPEFDIVYDRATDRYWVSSSE